MTSAPTNPTGFYELDLQNGIIRTRHGERVVAISDSIVGVLVSSALRGNAKTINELGRHLGSEIARTIGDIQNATPEDVLTHVASVLSIFGWGKLSLERWGDALAMRISNAPQGVTADAMATLLAGLLVKLTARELACVPVSEDSFLILHPSTVGAVRSWTKKGEGLSVIVGKLQRSEA